MLCATEFIKPMVSGISQPLLFKCDDGNFYIIKLKDNPVGIKVLANELIGNKIAQLLKLPVPAGHTIMIPPELVSASQYTRAGMHFGIHLVDGALDYPPLELIETAVNVDCVPGMYVFDYFIANFDRHYGNIMVKLTPLGNEILLIDQSNIFGSCQWTPEQVHLLASMVDPVYCQVHQELAHLITGRDPFGSWLDIVENIQDELLEAIIEEIPNEWNIDDEERKALLVCLTARKGKVRTILDSMKLQFPNWTA